MLLSSEDAASGGFVGHVPLAHRVPTIFSVLGDSMAWLCVAITPVYIALVLLPRRLLLRFGILSRIVLESPEYVSI